VSPGPGILFFVGPDIEECAERSFLRLLLPQELQFGISDKSVMIISLFFPHSRHRYSNIGMTISFFDRVVLTEKY